MNQSLLEQAEPYCDAATGEVLKRMPAELMQQLREAKLAVGVGSRPSERTETSATWFVFFSDEIRQTALAASRKRRRPQPKGPARKSARGLGQFTRKRQSAKQRGDEGAAE